MAAPTAIVPTPAVGRSLAAELFVLGYPLILMDAVRRTHPLASPRFHKLPPDPATLGRGLGDQDVLTVQSSAMIDLAMGPAILHLPDVRGRYVALTLIDSAGEPFGSLGSRTRDAGASDVALVGPHWHGEIKRGFRARRAPSDGVWAVSRITANSPADLATVEELAAHQCAMPLLKPAPRAVAATLPKLDTLASPLAERVVDLPPEVFVHRLCLLLERAPDAFRDPVQAVAAARLASLGGPEAAADWPDEIRYALSLGFSDGLAAIAAAARAARGADINGWTTPQGGTAFTPLARAARAYAHLGAPLPEDVLILNCANDESGRPLTGGERYRIQFPAGGLPPAEAVWRLVALPLESDGAGPAPRGACSDRSDYVFGPENALELSVQSEAPGAGSAVNWLQSPSGAFHLLMRLYWPRAPALNGAWRMPPVERLGSRAARRAKGQTSPGAPSNSPSGRTPRAPASSRRISP